MSRLFDNGSSQFAEWANADFGAAPLTIAAWVYHDEATTQCAVALANNTATGDYFELQINSAHRVLANTVASGSGASAQTGTGTINTWMHACAVFAAANSRAAYVNGGDKGTNTTSRTPSGMNTWAIGRVPASTPLRYFSGRIAEVGVWNVALTDAEVAALGAGVSPLMIRPASLYLYVPMLGQASPEPSFFHNTGIGSAKPSFTLTGTTAAEHPRVIYPRPPQVRTKIPVTSSVAASAGTAAASGVGASMTVAPGSSAGVATASGTGTSTAAATGASAGVGTSSGIAASQAASGASAAGTASAAGIGAATAAAVASASGSSAVDFVSVASDGAGSAAGSGTGAGVGSATAAGVGAASGVAAPSSVGAADSRASAASSGIASVTGVGAAVGSGVGVAAGTSVVAGEGTSVGDVLADGAAQGSAVASGAGASAVSGIAAANGVSTASGTGVAEAPSVAASSGSGSGAAVSIVTAATTGSSAGSGAGSAVSAVTAASVVSASGVASGSFVGSTVTDASHPSDIGIALPRGEVIQSVPRDGVGLVSPQPSSAQAVPTVDLVQNVPDRRPPVT